MTTPLHLTSTITCSCCGHSETETMPLDACIYLYECVNCQNLMTPQSGDCCVFCSRGTHPCPTSQRESKAYSPLFFNQKTYLTPDKQGAVNLG